MSALRGRSARRLIPLGTTLLAVSLGLCPDSSLHGEFLPGQVWRDTEGKPINAHGGGMLCHDGIYYWYGENKSGRTFLPDSNKNWEGTRLDFIGVSCYSSTNLQDWKNEGLVLKAVSEDAANDLHPRRVVERPKVIFNRTTKQFVMWMHIDSGNYAAAKSGVAMGGRATGPFQYLGSFRPNAGVWPENATAEDKQSAKGNPLARDFEKGQMARDMTLFVDDDGQAYHFYSSEENATMHVSLLSGDYLRPAGRYRRIFIRQSLEAPAVFKRNGKYYMIASGCTGWNPNAAHSAVADSPWGPWKDLGNPCQGENSDTTFTSQGTFILPMLNDEPHFIWMADRWKKWDLANSRYIWLPLEFTPDGKPLLRYRDHWSLSPASPTAAHAGSQL